MTRRQLAGLLITIAGVASIAVATLTPVSGNSEHSPWWCVTCGSITMADALVNVVLFIPAGIGLALLSRRTAAAIIVLSLASVAIELAQVVVITGRDTALRDVLANTLGAMVGVGVVRQWRRWLVPEPNRAVRLTLSAAAAWAVTLGMTVVLSHPSTPPEGYWGQHGGVAGGGHVVHAAVNGAIVPLGSFLDSRPVLAALNSDDPRVEVIFVPGEPSGESEPIARVSNPNTEAFRLSQRGYDLVFSIRTRSADIGLRSPIVRLADAIATSGDRNGGSPAETVAVLGRLNRGILSLDRTGTSPSHVALRITPTTGWVYFAPSAITTHVASWIVDGLWVAALLFPIGYWGAAALPAGRAQRSYGRSPSLLPTVGLAIAGPLALVARITGAPPPAWTTWCFAVGGLLIGVFALRLVRSAVRDPAS